MLREDYPEARWASQADLRLDHRHCCGDDAEAWFGFELEFVILLRLCSTYGVDGECGDRRKRKVMEKESVAESSEDVEVRRRSHVMRRRELLRKDGEGV